MADYQLNQPGATIQQAIDKALEIEGELQTEIAAREAADELLATKTELQSEATARQSADALKADVSDLTAETQRAAAAEQALSSRATAIEGKIPTAATAQNQLADKAYVNDSVTEASANYISYNDGPFPSVADLNAYYGPHDKNDYAYVISTDSAGNTIYSRYKFNGTSWVKEYDLNNSSFTSAQWATINSGMISADKTKIDGISAGAQVNIIETIKVNGTAISPTDKAVNVEVPTTLASLAEDTTHRVVTDTEKTTWSGKYTKPSGGIPASDIADGVIPDVSGKVNTSDIADNLTTNDATKVLSAKQGKVLNENLTQLGQEVTDLEASQRVSEKDILTSDFWSIGNISSTTGQPIASQTNVYSPLIMVSPGSYVFERPQDESRNYVFSWCVAKYDKDGTFISRSNYEQGSSVSVDESTCFVRIAILKDLYGTSTHVDFVNVQELDNYTPIRFYNTINVKDNFAKFLPLESANFPGNIMSLDATIKNTISGDLFEYGNITTAGVEQDTDVNIRSQYVPIFESGNYRFVNPIDSGGTYDYFAAVAFYGKTGSFVSRSDFASVTTDYTIDANTCGFVRLIIHKQVHGGSAGVSFTEAEKKYLRPIFFYNTKIDEEQAQLDACTNSLDIVPSNSHFDNNSSVQSGVVGIWAMRYTSGGNSISKVENNGDVYFDIALNTAGGSNPGIWALNWLTSSEFGKKAVVTFEYKASKNFNVTVNNGTALSAIASNAWKRFYGETTVGSNYADRRIFIYCSSTCQISIKGLRILVEDNFFEIRKELEQMSAQNVEDILLPLKNYSYKTATIERGAPGQCVIGLLGDSWTQHNNASYLEPHTNYIEPLVLALREKYGNAGGGFYSFGISHGNYVSKMGCAISADANDTRSSDTEEGRSLIEYFDQVTGCLWVDATYQIFHQGANLTLNVVASHNAFVIHFYGGSGYGKFTYALDEGTPIVVDTSEYTGHSMITITTTNAPHTIVFNATDGDVIILGVDMQITGVRGVRVHKLANKGATTNSFVIVDETAWKAGLQSLELDTITIMLGINDGAGATTTVYNNLKTIVNRIVDVNPYCDVAIIQPSNTKVGDYSNQAAYQYKLASEKGLPFVSLIPLFGSSAQIVAKGTFYDSVHPTKNGGRMIANYLLDKLFK